MDLFVIAFVAAITLLTGLALGLEVVGYGRLQIAAAGTAVVTSIISFLLLHHAGSILQNAPADPLQSADHMFTQFARYAALAQLGFNAAECALIVFVTSGAVRIWTRRQIVWDWCARSSHDFACLDSQPCEPKPTVTQQVVGYCVMLVFLGWVVYAFAFNDHGISYYYQHPHMLLYALGTAALIALAMLSLKCIARQVSRKPKAVEE